MHSWLKPYACMNPTVCIGDTYFIILYRLCIIVILEKSLDWRRTTNQRREIVFLPSFRNKSKFFFWKKYSLWNWAYVISRSSSRYKRINDSRSRFDNSFKSTMCFSLTCSFRQTWYLKRQLQKQHFKRRNLSFLSSERSNSYEYWFKIDSISWRLIAEARDLQTAFSKFSSVRLRPLFYIFAF